MEQERPEGDVPSASAFPTILMGKNENNQDVTSM